MTDIPDDISVEAIKIAARASVGWQGSGEDSAANMVNEIAAGLLAERERAATAAETRGRELREWAIASDIATTIRNPSAPPANPA